VTDIVRFFDGCSWASLTGLSLGGISALHRYWPTRDRAANVRLFRLASEVLSAIEAGAFYPNAGWQCTECPFRSRCRAWG
jgi:hypothetical protein